MTIATAATADLDAGLTEQQVIRKIAWRLMPLIIICYFFAFFDRVTSASPKPRSKPISGSATRPMAT